MNAQYTRALHNIYTVNLGVKRHESVLVFCDSYSRDLKKIGKGVAQAGKEHAHRVTFFQYEPTGCHGVEPPDDLWAEAFGKTTCEELRQKNLFKPIGDKKITKQQLKEIEEIIGRHKGEAVNAVIALSYYSTSHTRFRDLLNRICGARYASMPLFDEAMLAGPMMVDWKGMRERTKGIARRVNRCEMISIEAPNGTSMYLSKRGREAKVDTGIITRQGQFSNLPAGEVYLAPLEGSARGRLVLEWAPTRKLKNPITLFIEKGCVRDIEGKEKYVSYLQEKLSEKKENRNIAELGIGTNDRAKRPDNILESEKILGTIHIALGDNSSFGGKVSTSFHQDFVLFKPTVTLIYGKGRQRTLMKGGNVR